MKRRSFGLLAGSSVVALQAAGEARAQSAAPNAAQLGTTLMPLGGEMAGNADGSIPAWTGGMTTLPAGLNKNDYIPELFPDEQPIVVIDASNMADHAERLSEGVMTMMKKYDGYKIKVYPTHRTSSAPQYVYDNTAKNATTAKFVDKDPVGGRFGFENAFGGIPFPIPNLSEPLTAGAQIIWNHETRWSGYAFIITDQGWSVSGGQLSMAYTATDSFLCPYYDPNGSAAAFTSNGSLLQLLFAPYSSPPNIQGEQVLIHYSTNPYYQPQQAWELLNGQGRVRRAPELSYDTPSPSSNGIVAYDEYYGFQQSIDRYDWKYLSKKEMYIPYNNNALYAATPQEALLAHFINPDLVRWELHRCWEVEATLHPGERNVLPRRRFYIDEDTWMVALVHSWDANGNLYKVGINYNYCRPDLPGTVYGHNTTYNLQTGDYVLPEGPYDQKTHASVWFKDDISMSVFDPQAMAASGQY